MDVTIRIAGEEKLVRVLDETQDRARNLRRPFADAGERIVRKIAKRLSGAVLDANTGRLKASLMHKETKDTLEISAGGGPKEVAYAAIHHFGGVIRPKKKKFLTIPFPGGPADKPVPLRASDFEDTFVAAGIIFQSQEHESVPLFILKKSVTIPARPYMYLEDSDEEYLKESIRDFIAGAWK